ncbi:peptide ABC transporter substrate-binding protein [Solibacillus daqui]|uniref:peptide ABC transporter substrate-binding protein n=1 Tax=Solibacillus daqui TaxID=2912187 RepID=UPI00236507CA|nr:peptide ABC transporter substrate-binding protein [Solibacillus daqui]
MVQIVLPNNEQILMHSPLYNFTSEIRHEPNTITILKQPTTEAYKPFSLLQHEGFIYFDLWSYSFALQLYQVLKAHDVVKGVIRIRRTTENAFPIEEDLLALEEWYGPVRNIKVRSNAIGATKYVIVLCEFGEQIMAHLEYMHGEARIEFEWSSHQHIVEFDSAQMTGDSSNNHNLYKHVEAIVEHAISWDVSYDEKLKKIQALLQRGEQ